MLGRDLSHTLSFPSVSITEKHSQTLFLSCVSGSSFLYSTPFLPSQGRLHQTHLAAGSRLFSPCSSSLPSPTVME